MKKIAFIALGFAIVASFGFYPIDGYERSRIERLLYIQDQIDSGAKYTRIEAGAYASIDDIKLNLKDISNTSIDDLLNEDPEFSKKIARITPGGAYSLAVMDITDPNNIRYASHREDVGYQPGSVGKIAVLNAVFHEMSKIYPDDFEARIGLLCNKRVSSGIWGLGDHHTIPIYNKEKKTQLKRQVIASDEFTLFEWLDHMVSVSNNGAASVMYREAMLMSAFGKEYPRLTEEEATKYFEDTNRDSLTVYANRVVNDPLRDIGITEDDWRLGGFFTDTPGKYVGRMGGSIGTPKGLMKYLVQLEQGKVVDEASSLEMKRLLYITDRRIRYAQSNRLDSARVYFKSGSFYSCDKTKPTPCGDYAGNRFNYMNSVITVEHPNGKNYIVCLMTNVLSKNSAGAHMYLASAIDKVVTEE
ncbi:serine hydrolase [Patiriisocius marinistellae]|nr:serine hydrolase [Patiriisocius marinistellae]